MYNFKIDFAKLTDKDLYKYCKETGLNARIWNRRFIATIPEVARRRLYKKYGYCSIHEFAAKLAGVSHNNVDGVLRVDEKLKDMPKIKSLISEKGLNKVRLVSNIVKPETENFWAEKIKAMTFSSLRIFINEKFRFKTEDIKNDKKPLEQGQIGMFDLKNFKSQNRNESNGKIVEISETRGGAIPKKTFTIQIDNETEFELRKFKLKLEKEKKEPVDWNTALKELVKRATTKRTAGSSVCQTKPVTQKGSRATVKRSYVASVVAASQCTGNRLTHSKITPIVTRYIPSKIKRHLEQKYNGCCAYTGCNKPYEHIHHPARFSERPNHENLMPLCKEHHDFIHQSSKNSTRHWADSEFNRFKAEQFAASG
ncbi:hypothetical protein JW911_04070 [Candidatus Peregrinibacteria bacterium]|nr:hypothetical protein [Candidatus Peregrinibacteria bacterium]